MLRAYGALALTWLTKCRVRAPAASSSNAVVVVSSALATYRSDWWWPPQLRCALMLQAVI